MMADNKTGVLLALFVLISLLFLGGCSRKSRFLAGFSLEALASHTGFATVNRSQTGIGPGIEAGGEGIGFGTGKTKQDQSVSLACLVAECGKQRVDAPALL